MFNHLVGIGWILGNLNSVGDFIPFQGLDGPQVLVAVCLTARVKFGFTGLGVSPQVQIRAHHQVVETMPDGVQPVEKSLL